MTDSRQFVPELEALLVQDGGRSSLLAPAPGLWRDAPSQGTLVQPGMVIGELEQLGVLHRLKAPQRAVGVVVEPAERSQRLARRPVDYGAVLLTLDPEAVGSTGLATSDAAASVTSNEGTLVFRSPSSGRFFSRPSPDKPAFVSVGDVIQRGQTIGVLEVMKTFTRIHYDDARLPERARVQAIVVADQAEIDAGAALLVLEAIS